MSIQSEKLMTLAGGEALYNDLRNRVDDRAPIIIDSKSGNPVAISDGVPGLKLYDAKVSFAPKQEGTGDPSPTNIRPITGWDGVQIVNGGENVLPFGDVYEEGWTDTVDGLTASYSNGVFSITGNHTVSGWTNFTKETVWSSNPIILPPGTYTPANQLCIRCSIDGGEFANKSTTFTAKTNVVVRGFYIAVQGEGEKSLSVPLIMSPGSTIPTEYVPHRETAVYPVSWQTEVGTVYSGELDVLTGVLTVDMARADMGSATWTIETNGDVHWFKSSRFLTGAKILSSNSYAAYIVSDRFKNIQAAKIYSGEAEDNTIAQESTNKVDGNLRVKATSYNDDTEAFKTAMSGVYVYYELTAPLTYQLTPTQIALVAGINNIWTDANNLQIAYPVDTKKYVDAGSSDVKDVRVNGTSIVNSGVANIPYASASEYGLIKRGRGLFNDPSTGALVVDFGDSGQIKQGTNTNAVMSVFKQHESVFYGLAKVAGADLASQTVTLGQYPNAAKSAIQTMIGVEAGVSFIEEKTGSSVVISGEPNVKYECGEVSSITITAPEHGTIDVWFATGSTPAILTTSNVIFPSWFDHEYLEANTIYEFVITDCYGGVCTWERPATV